ncbi:DUF4139 domain-containing protein [Streptomyces radiopugnans]|uniref:DUF4139 domain-containing protein n=1 Tax=Streptomyces radiopugnans TaxID=403935 RepID=A0A1H9FL59_9ACTN|nr:DUF4139 domain-containing protein [Streptomyces radiopugnans]SEQ38078.1 conserved hypothetical protein [Streptomyces radiopugnans]
MADGTAEGGGARTGAGAGPAPDPGPEPVLESALESVVVHAVGAVCVRRARCVLPPGPPAAPDAAVRVRVEGLPIALYDHSLRGRVVSGPPGLRVTDARVVRVAAPRQDRELPALRLELEEAEDRLDRLRERRDRLAEEVGRVAELRAVPPQQRRGDPPRWAPVESLLALANFVDGRLALLHERLRAVEAELSGAEYEVGVLVHRLEAASSALPAARAGESAAAVLTLERPGEAAEHAGSRDEQDSAEAELEVEYHVPGATWSPVYQLRLDDAASGSGSGSGGTLVLRACVAQRTGEDWTGVRLGLSTADLLRRTDVPRLRSLRIGRRQEEPAARGWREPPPGLEELFAGYDAAVPPGPLPAPVPARAGGAPPPVSAAPVPGAAAEPETGRTLPEAHHGFAAYGAPAAASAPAPLAPASPGGLRAAARAAAVSPPSPPPPPGPAEGMLDYSGLTLAGPDEPGRRGRLRPAPDERGTAVAEHRRRAESVARLARPSHAVDVRQSAGSFHHRYDTAAPVDVAADGAWHTVPVREIPVETVPEYVCVPSVDQTVYGTVLLTNASGHPLPAGPADVVVDGGFVLTTPLPTLAPGECRRVGTGAVESVKAARRTRLRESTAGLRGGTTVLDHTVEVELANRLAHRITVEVRERVPVGTDKEVRIEERPAEPPWTAADGPLDDPDGGDGRHVRGVRIWRVELEPGRTTVLRGGYEVRIPAGKALVGGNRRD